MRRFRLVLLRAITHLPDPMRTLFVLLISVLHSVRALFRSREEQALVELALQQQLATYAPQQRRLRLSPLDRVFWIALSRVGPR